MPYMIGKRPGGAAGQFNATQEFFSGVTSVQMLSGSRSAWTPLTITAPKGCTGFILAAEDNIGTAGGGCVDIGVGAVGSEAVIARNIYKEWTPVNQGLPNFGGFYPLSINEGLPLSIRGQGSATHHFKMSMTLVRGNHGNQFQYCEGMSGVIRAKQATSSWTVIGSSGKKPWKGFMPFIGEDGGGQGDANISYGYGYGNGAGSFFRKVGRYQANHDMGPGVGAAHAICFPMHIEPDRTLYAFSSVSNIVMMSHILFR